MAVPLIQIPGNIKQQFLPFVLNPDSELHKWKKSIIELNNSNCSPQFFSYRAEANTDAQYESGVARLQFYPSSLDNVHIDDDISYKLLFARKKGGIPSKDRLTLNDVLTSIPGVSIREFLPDTRLDQCINMFTSLISEMTKLFTKNENQSSGQSGNGQSTDTKSDNPWYKKLSDVAWFTMRYMTGISDPNLFTDISESTTDQIPCSNYNSDILGSTGNKSSPGFYVMKFPYILYYRLQSCTTTNVYEIPAQSDSKVIGSSEGYAGWTNGGNDIMSSGGLRLSGFLSKIPIIGELANMVIGNIGINYMPWWNAEQGTTTKEPEVTIKFDLFNDTADAAMANFIFVNTLIPNNKWLQYNMFQHSSNIYDVKIEGINRLFACAGSFNVTYDGILRDPPEEWIDNLAKKHLNQNMNKKTFMSNAKNNRIIKIPDVYHVELKFQSLLPANFNNFIFTYAENTNHMATYCNKVYDPSTFTKTLADAIGNYAGHVKTVWDSGIKSVDKNYKG